MTAKYRILSKRFWTDPRVRELKHDEQLFFAYCITGEAACSHTAGTGIYEIHRGWFAGILNLEMNRVSEIIDVFNSTGDLLSYDAKNHVIFVKSFTKHNCKYKTLAQAIKHDYELTGHKVPHFWAEFVEKNRTEIEKIYNSIPEKDLEEHQYWLNLLSLKDKLEVSPKNEVEKSVAVKFSMEKSLNR